VQKGNDKKIPKTNIIKPGNQIKTTDNYENHKIINPYN